VQRRRPPHGQMSGPSESLSRVDVPELAKRPAATPIRRLKKPSEIRFFTASGMQGRTHIHARKSAQRAQPLPRKGRAPRGARGPKPADEPKQPHEPRAVRGLSASQRLRESRLANGVRTQQTGCVVGASAATRPVRVQRRHTPNPPTTSAWPSSSTTSAATEPVGPPDSDAWPGCRR
jgi:hypothetical protein